MSIIICCDIYGKEYSFEESVCVDRISVYGLCVQDHKVLLVQDAWVKKWELPGGGVDVGESLEEGLAREFFEETGLIIQKSPQLIFKTTNIFLGPNQDVPWKSKRYFYNVLIKEGALNKKSEVFDVLAAQFFPIDELSKIQIEKEKKDILFQLLKKTT